MSTIDLGKIKITWRGTYNASTAYAVDDAVYYSGSSWINKQAGTGQTPQNSSAYWDKMSQGSDLGSISGLAQGDIIYYTGSDFARLAAGTSGFSLVTKGAGQNPVWESASANFARQMKYHQQSSAISFSSTSYSDTGISLTFDNPLKSTNSLVKITFGSVWGSVNNDNHIEIELRDAGGSKITNVIGNPNSHFGSNENESSAHMNMFGGTIFATVSSTTPIAYRPFVKRSNANGSQGYLGRDHDSSTTFPTTFIIEEYAV
jgi:hypothetical protein